MNDIWTACRQWLVMSEIMRNPNPIMFHGHSIWRSRTLWKIKYKWQLFMESSAVSLCLIFPRLDLPMDFYCRNRCWILKEIFDCLHWNVTWLFEMMRRNRSSSTFFLFSLFSIYRNILKRYTADANCEKSEFGLKERKKTLKKYFKKVTPTPRFTDTPF